jgi:hypothetical protein
MHKRIVASSDPPQHPRSLGLPLLPDAYTFSYPKEADKAPKVHYYPLPDILTRAWTTDAHTTAYCVERWPYRLSKEAVHLDSGVVMVVFIVDVDCTLSHAARGGQGDAPAPDAWWLAELDKIERLQAAFPDAFIYRTRGGYRIVYVLPAPRTLCLPEDVTAWKADYLAWVTALRQRFNIFGDPSCCDWQRLYRVPHATRTPGGRPEARETLGSPDRIGLWTCEPTMVERELAKTLAKRPSTRRSPVEDTRPHVDAGSGVLFYAFKARDWLGKELESGKWSVLCPWNDQHTEGKTFDTSTVLYAPGAGDTLGFLFCWHAHCQARDSCNVLRLFSRAELDDAAREAGLPPFRTVTSLGTAGDHRFSAKRCLRMIETKAVIARRGLRTIDARELSAWRR